MAPLNDRTRRGMAAYLLAMAAVVAVVSGLGVFARGDGSTKQFLTVRGETVDIATTGVYVHNAERVVAEGVGWDLVTLLLVVPALVLVARGVARGSLRARLMAIGLLAYLFYQYLMYAMTWAVGPLLLPFVGLYAASLVGIAWFVASTPPRELDRHITERFPRRGMAVFSAVMALILMGMWLPMIATVVGGELDGVLQGQTTLVVQALDLGLVVPLAIATAVLVWRRRPWGTLLAAALVVKGLAMSTAITAMVLSAWYVEGELDTAGLVIFVAAAVACLLLTRSMYRAIAEEPRVDVEQPLIAEGVMATDIRHPAGSDDGRGRPWVS